MNTEERRAVVNKLLEIKDLPLCVSTFNLMSRYLGWCPGCMEDSNGDEYCAPCYDTLNWIDTTLPKE